MRIDIENLAAVGRADVEIDGITVIAGANDTGKSTVSKALWCMFDSFYKYEKQFDSYRQNAIESAVRSTLPKNMSLRAPSSLLVRRITQDIIDGIKTSKGGSEAIDDILVKTIENAVRRRLFSAPPEDWDSFEPLRHMLEDIVSYDDVQLIRGVMNNNFMSEFSEQPSNADSPDERGTVKLTIQGESTTATIANNEVVDISSLTHLDVRAIYMDDPFILDDIAYGYGSARAGDLFDEDRHQRLRRLMRRGQRRNGNVLSEMMTEDRLSKVLEQIDIALSGHITRNNSRELLYIPEGYDSPINARNISAGMKAFCILDLLLRNGSIEHKSTIILDEPEVHLHPEWQLVFAELIVLMQKAFDLHVLLTTHSPYFLRAIQVYAAKHSIATHCRYYHARRVDKWCEISDETDRTAPIFDELVRPFEELEREMGKL